MIRSILWMNRWLSTSTARLTLLDMMFKEMFVGHVTWNNIEGIRKMLATRLLVQKLKSDGSIIQSFTRAEKDYVFDFNYDFEETAKNLSIFPVQPYPDLDMIVKPVGKECKYKVNPDNNTLYFSETYAVPSGMMIAIILPKGYKPISMGFSENVHIPNGAILCSVESPGYVNTKYLPKEDITVLFFNMIKNASIKFSFTAMIKDEHKDAFFLENREEDFYDYTTYYTKTDGLTITSKDLESFNHYFINGSDLNLIATEINRMLNKETTEDDKIIVARRITQMFTKTMATGNDIVSLLAFFVDHKDSIGGLISALLMSLQFGL